MTEDGAERRVRHTVAGCGADLTASCFYFPWKQLVPVVSDTQEIMGWQERMEYVVVCPLQCPACGKSLLLDKPASPIVVVGKTQ